MIIGIAPQLIVSWRTVRSSGEKPRILVFGRKRAMARTVNPVRDMQRMASASISVATRQAAMVMVSVTLASASPSSVCTSSVRWGAQPS